MPTANTIRTLALILALAAVVARPEPARAQAQDLTITAAGFIDSFGGSDPDCPGCNGVEQEDRDRANTDPLPAMEFVLFDAAGQEIGRQTTTLFLGIQRAVFQVQEEEQFTLELVADPVNWQLCPNESRTRTILRSDFVITSVTERFHFTQGCRVADVTPTEPPPSPTVPGSTPEPTRPPATRAPDDDGDDDEPARGSADALGQIRGIAFIDLNQDGRIGPGEPGLNDVKVNLGGGGLELSQITPGAGTFNFAGLGRGHYDVFIAPGPEWRITTPSKYTVEVQGNDVAGIDFGLIRVGEPMPSGVTSAAAPRTARRLVIPAPGAGISLPATGILDMTTTPLAGGLAILLGLVAAIGVTLERRHRR
jgi:hypothetical protein